MKGIDISAWQENIDWQAVGDAGIEFVVVKLGENGRVDPMFVQHINDAISKGLKIGVYLYSHATTVDEAIAEADFVNEQIKTYLDGKCPEIGIWFDVEDPGIEAAGVDITALCSEFINQLQAAGYKYVGVYSSYNWLTNGNIDTSRLPDTPIWVAQYNYECNYEGPNLKVWQYTDSLNIGGINFDGNEYYG